MKNFIQALTTSLNITQAFHYTKDDKTFTVESSDINYNSFSRYIALRNPKTGRSVNFHFTHHDTDATKEDIYGSWYISDDNQYKLLIIND
jgi:hypothetical protein